MLAELSIDNFAIIDHLLLRFYPGFTVLTGETGAGKSIIIDALQAALGARTASDVVRGDARFAAVEAVFEVPPVGSDSALDALLEEYGIEDEGCLILRREISSSGRSTARINGRAVPLSALGALGSLLVDIHGQSDHLSILRRDRQLDVLDRYGGLLALRQRAAETVQEYGRLRRELDTLAGGQREAEQRLDLLRFQVDEIEAARLRPDEEDELHAEKNLLVNAERLTHLSTETYEALQGDAGAADAVRRAATSMRELAGIDRSLTPLAERLETAQYELEDLAQEARQYRDGVEYDPKRLDEIEDRLDVVNRLRRKYGETISEVLAFGERVRAEMEDIENFDERLADLAAKVEEVEAQAGTLVEELSQARQKTAGGLGEAMREALQGLGLKDTSFETEVTQSESQDGIPVPESGNRYAYSLSGIDTVGFLVSFNPGEPLRPLERVASGGETSRFLLALKSVLAEADRTPTLIFDEVDVGVGGRRGMDVGERMRNLSRSHQVISVTHLPQIAALADQHLTTVKSVAGGRTSVEVRTLETPERIVEIAEMMSGTGTEAARRNAQELLEAAQRYR